MINLKIVLSSSNSHLDKLSNPKDKTVKPTSLKTIFLALLLSLSFGLAAEELKSPRIAILDWQGALMESTKVQEEFKKADQQLGAERSEEHTSELQSRPH